MNARGIFDFVINRCSALQACMEYWGREYFDAVLDLTKAVISGAHWEQLEMPRYWLLIETLLCWDYWFFSSLVILDLFCTKLIVHFVIDFSLLILA